MFRKPKNTDEHFAVTTGEPYGVCCIEGLKVSMIMVRANSPLVRHYRLFKTNDRRCAAFVWGEAI